jgi:hypothetical protein
VKLMKILAAGVAPLALSGCFILPGQFGSTLDIRRNGDFTYTYKGEIIFASPENMGKKSEPKIWKDSWAKCSKDGDPYYNEYEDEAPVAEASSAAAAASEAADAAAAAADAADVDAAAKEVLAEATAEDYSSDRPCTKAEIAKLKKDYDVQLKAAADAKAKEGREFAQMFGVDPTSETSMKEFAVNLEKQAGWKSVTYAGKGKFMVDYVVTAQLGYDYVFPVFPETTMMMPFVTVKMRADGSALVYAPAFAPGSMANMGGAMGRTFGGGLGAKSDDSEGPVVEGNFTVTTDGEILTNNTEEGPTSAPGSKKLVWQVGKLTQSAPRALIKLK